MNPDFSPLRPMAAAIRSACMLLLAAALSPAAWAAGHAGHAPAAEAEAVAEATVDALLPTVEVTGARQDAGFAARRAGGATKSDATLFETPQSVTVLTRELLDTRQAISVAEAIQATAGVSAGSFGRRGWDDFFIRGQRASESIFVDGLSLGQSNWIAQELSGVERVEILKGPASINFGLVQPGGMVNMVSKRPRTEAFNQVSATVGSYGYRQGSFDIGRPLSASGKAAFRLNGMASNSDDATDFVYFKNRYIAPSLSLDLGPATELTLLAAYNSREYLRQQGLPLKGSLLPNKNGEIDRSLFTGDAGFGPYNAEQIQFGYALAHQFESGWKLRQNFRWQGLDMMGRAVFMGALQANEKLQNRTGTLQDIQGHTLALDSNAERAVELAGLRHSVMLGLDLSRDELRNGNTACSVPALDLYRPVYNVAYSCPSRPNSLSTGVVRFTGLYLRDQVSLAPGLNLTMALRRDHVENRTLNGLNGRVQQQKHNATTGNAALLYQITPNVAPYVSFANSFLPVAGTDFFGAQFKPEKGRQAEAGVKFQSDDGRITGAVAIYDLTRENVATADPDPAHIALLPGAQVQTGEQRSKGFEAEASADLRNGWSLQASLTLNDAKLTRDNSANVGKVLQNMPRNSANLWATYRVRSGALRGWGAGLGARHEGEKSSFSVNHAVPAYTVADASLSYQGASYRLQLNVKNLFDKEYFAGVLNNNVVPLGDPRTVLLKAIYDF